MAVNSRESLKQYCLRSLGAPVNEVNVEDWQLEDRWKETEFPDFKTWKELHVFILNHENCNNR